jgi:hypothetical protein
MVQAGLNYIFGCQTNLIVFGRMSIELHIEQNNLAGMLPTEIGLFLPVLQRFSLAGNDISNTVPSEICKLSTLLALHLHGNTLDGDFPS